MANKTFTTLKENVGSEVQDTSVAFAIIIGRFINRRYFQILRAINWKNINPAATLTMVSGTQNYVLPYDYGKPVSVYDVTNNMSIAIGTIGDLYRFYGDQITNSGSIERCAIYEDAVMAQPSSASKLAIASASASDTTQTIQISGTASGTEVYETQTLTGTTPVASTYTYTTVKGISFSAVRVGVVTITSNSAAVTNATIPLTNLDVRYKLMKMHYVPTAVATINIPYIINPMPMVNDYDFPVSDIGDLIELGAISDALKFKKQYQKAQVYELMFTQGLADFIFAQENQETPFQFSPTTFDQGNLY